MVARRQIKQGVGIDLVSEKRFLPFKKGAEHSFIKKVFSVDEIKYCYSFSNPVPHLAGMYAAKEAASKALGLREYPFIELEIKHSKTGAPEVWRRGGKKLPVLVSITHEGGLAAAIALK